MEQLMRWTPVGFVVNPGQIAGSCLQHQCRARSEQYICDETVVNVAVPVTKIVESLFVAIDNMLFCVSAKTL